MTSTASATFYGGMPSTVRVMKTHLEYIFKYSKGIYAVVLVIPKSRESVILMCDWGQFFDRVNKHGNPESLLGRIKRDCPETVKLLQGDAEPFSQVSLELSTGETADGIGMEVTLPVPIDSPIHLFGSLLIEQQAFRLFKYSVSIFIEIQNNCKIPGWKEGLKEIW